MNSVERVFAAINHEPVDKPAKGELGVAHELTKELLGTGTVGLPEERRVRELMHFDLFNWWCAGSHTVRAGTGGSGEEVYQDAWGDVARPVFGSVAELDGFNFPSLDAFRHNTEVIRYFRENSGLFVLGQTEGVLTPMYTRLFGWDNCMIFSAMDTERLGRFAMELAEFFAALAAMLIDAGAHGILIGDDLAFNTGTFISPRIMREFVFPALKREVALIKAHADVPVFFHTDGDINAVLDDIVGCGFDGLQSLQPSAGMDLRSVKARYGGRLCLMGNIDLNYVLPFGTEEEVRQNVRETLDIGMQGGGFILSTCNILTKDVPARNAVAMYDEAERYRGVGTGK